MVAKTRRTYGTGSTIRVALVVRRSKNGRFRRATREESWSSNFCDGSRRVRLLATERVPGGALLRWSVKASQRELEAMSRYFSRDPIEQIRFAKGEFAVLSLVAGVR